jgi:hypothetical protein
METLLALSGRFERQEQIKTREGNRSSREVLVLYLKRPRLKRWLQWRDLRALRVQRLEGSRPPGLWDLYASKLVLIGCQSTLATGALAHQWAFVGVAVCIGGRGAVRKITV